MRYNERSLRRANCNGVAIELIAYWGRGTPEKDAYYVLHVEDLYANWGGPDEIEYDDKTEAIEAFEGFVEEYRNKPNWNAQAAYDEANGTVNGEDPGVVQMRELWGE